MKMNEVDAIAAPVLRHLEQVDDAVEARAPGEIGGDVRQADRLDRIHLDLAVLVHTVAAANLDVRPGPDAHAAGDFPPFDRLAKPLGEDHAASVRRPRRTRDGSAPRLRTASARGRARAA